MALFTCICRSCQQAEFGPMARCGHPALGGASRPNRSLQGKAASGYNRAQSEIWWADLGPRQGSAPAWRRPVLIVSADAFNRSRIKTVTVAALTSNLRLAAAPGNVALAAGTAGLDRDCVVNGPRTLNCRALRQRGRGGCPTPLGDAIKQLTRLYDMARTETRK